MVQRQKKGKRRVKNIRGLEGSTYERFTRDLATAKHLSSLAYTVDARSIRRMRIFTPLPIETVRVVVIRYTVQDTLSTLTSRSTVSRPGEGIIRVAIRYAMSPRRTAWSGISIRPIFG